MELAGLKTGAAELLLAAKTRTELGVVSTAAREVFSGRAAHPDAGIAAISEQLAATAESFAAVVDSADKPSQLALLSLRSLGNGPGTSDPARMLTYLMQVDRASTRGAAILEPIERGLAADVRARVMQRIAGAS